jgi:diguanylate cyclase (GGDEF)-like protein
MDGAFAPVDLVLGSAAIDRLMPMHVAVATGGQILSAGPTLAKLFAGRDLAGQAFFDLFRVRRPGGIAGPGDLVARAGERLYLAVDGVHLPGLRGVAQPLAAGRGVLMNLSFGIGVLDAVRHHRLTDADFAPTDLAIELLYLMEAKSALMEELRQLNLRLQGAKSVAEEQALTDTLTGLRNRRALDAALERAIAGGAAFGLMHLDLDFFKAVNDTLGHAAGDHVLGEVARVLRLETRGGDTVARVGGDEFVILLPGLADGVRLQAIACRIIGRLQVPIPWQDQVCRISASIGMTVSTLYARPDPAVMLADADRALYASKHAGRGRSMLLGQGAPVLCAPLTDRRQAEVPPGGADRHADPSANPSKHPGSAPGPVG